MHVCSFEEQRLIDARKGTLQSEELCTCTIPTKKWMSWPSNSQPLHALVETTECRHFFFWMPSVSNLTSSLGFILFLFLSFVCFGFKQPPLVPLAPSGSPISNTPVRVLVLGVVSVKYLAPPCSEMLTAGSR